MMLLLYSKRGTILRGFFMNDLIDRSVQVVTQQPGYVKHVADRCCKCKLIEFSGEARFLICTQKWLLRTLTFCQFQTEII